MKSNLVVIQLLLISLLIGIVVPSVIFLKYQSKQQSAVVSGVDEEKVALLLSSPQAIAKGQALYKTACEICHGATGDGKGVAGIALKPPPRDFLNPTEPWKMGKEPKQVFLGITNGIPGTGMMAYGPTLSFEDRWALVHYINEFPGIKGQVEPLSLEKAKALYEELAE